MTLRIINWQSLNEAGQQAALARPAFAMQSRTLAQAQAIIDAVRAEGDAAIARYAREFDGVELGEIGVSAAEFAAARAELPAQSIRSLEVSIRNVRRFHQATLPQPLSLEVQPGVRCERLLRPIRSVGLYVPAGSAPLPSTVIMLAVPAAIAGCAQRVLCTPAQRNGRANAAVLVAAELCGVQQIFKVGGAQAIAAMAYGTASVPKVAKIFGPGNAWVTAAKQLVAADPHGAALDMPAGPSEVMVIADAEANAEFVAADLLAQAEHDPHAQALLVTDSQALASAVAATVGRQLQSLSRQSILQQSLTGSRIIVVATLATAVTICERYAPEHLIIQTHAPRELLKDIYCAGSVFLGPWSPETTGDYCAGPNHVLPTYGYARAYSGLSTTDFTRSMSVQELSATGLADLGPDARHLAQLEGLDAHALAVDVRLAALSGNA